MDNTEYRERNKKFIRLLICILFVVCLYYAINEARFFSNMKKSSNLITFSHTTGFYNEKVSVKLFKSVDVPLGTKVFYTLDGNDPTNESHQYTWNDKIELDVDENQTKIYPLKVVLYYNNQYSTVYQETYVIEKKIETRFDIPVISITCDSQNLYDWYSGIMVPGEVHYNEVMSGKKGYLLGNYNMRSDEWIRDAKVTMFAENGEILINQDIGLAISGGTSSEMYVKSLKLIAKYNGDNKFDIQLTDEVPSASPYSVINRYASIRLRSGAQDQKQGNIRSSVISRLAEQSNFDGCTTTRRAVVYLNGKFYGIFDMQENYSNSNIASRFGIENEDLIEKYKISESNVLESFNIKELFDADLDDENSRNELEKYVDMDNYLMYYAIEILSNNTDWPNNNYEAWRYTGNEIDGNKYTDGRIRFLIYDADMIYYSKNNIWVFENADSDTLEMIMESQGRSQNSTFKNVMKSKYYRDRFVSIVCDLRNTSFKKENVTSLIDEEYNKIKKENLMQFSEEENQQILFYIGEMKRSVEEKENRVDIDIQKYFSVSEKYQLSVTSTEGAHVFWNNIDLYNEKSYVNNYYKGIDLTMYCHANEGYKFLYWLINGNTKIYGNKLIINDEFIVNQITTVQPIVEKDSDTDLIIEEISANSDSDWMKFCNVGNEKINLGVYYISDIDTNYKKYKLPDIELEPGKSIIINGDKNYYASGDYICNFNLSVGENLYLYDSNKQRVIEKINVQNMDKKETYGRLYGSGDWWFFDNRFNQRKE